MRVTDEALVYKIPMISMTRTQVSRILECTGQRLLVEILDTNLFGVDAVK